VPGGHLPADLAAALAAKRTLPFVMLRVDLAGVAPPLCLLSGSGEIPFDGQIFKGTDERFGALAALDPPEDGAGDEAPNMGFDIATVSDAAAATLAGAQYQGSRVRAWVSAIVNDAGAIATPYLFFDGILNVPTLSIDKSERTLSFDCVSGFEYLFADSEGQRLADASHRAIHPGEMGFAHVTGVNRLIVWGPGDRPGSGGSTPPTADRFNQPRKSWREDAII
jgi:hypothetical protein